MVAWSTRGILAKEETPYGTNAVPTGADALLVEALVHRALEGTYENEERSTGLEGKQTETFYDEHAGFEFRIEAFTSGTAGTAPVYAHLLRGAGLSETVVANTSVDYSPTPFTGSPVGITFQGRNGIFNQDVVGCRGSLSFSAETGRKPKWQWNYKGTYSAPVAPVAITPTFTGYRDALTCTPRNMSAFTLGGQKLCVTSFSFSDGRNPTVNKYMNCPEVSIMPRMFTGQMTVEWPALADKDILEQARTTITEPLIFELGTVAGETLRITAPKCQIKFSGEQDIGGDLGVTLDLNFTPDQGDDEIIISYL